MSFSLSLYPLDEYYWKIEEKIIIFFIIYIAQIYAIFVDLKYLIKF